jgi:HEAT repeat protein
MKTKIFLILNLCGSLWVSGLAADAPVAGSDLDRLTDEAAKYEPGQSMGPFRGIETSVRQCLSNPAIRPAVEAALIRLLAPSASYEAQLFACRQLGFIGSNTALPALGNLLGDAKTTAIACLALTTYPAGKADEILRAGLTYAKGNARAQIFNTLGERRDAKSIKILTQAALESDQNVAEAAIASLGKIGDVAASKAIASLQAKVSAALQPVLTEANLRCAQLLAAAGDHKAASSIYESLLAGSEPMSVRRSALQGLLPLDHDQGERRIEVVLAGTDTALKPIAIAGVRNLQSKLASEKFGRLIPKLRPDEQVWMIESLAARGDEQARSAIGSAVALPDPVVRKSAIVALGRIGGPGSVLIFARALSTSPGADEARAIQDALVNLPGGTETDSEIIARMDQGSRQVRVQLLPVLAQREGAKANTFLLKEAGGTDPETAKAAFRALSRTAGPDDLPILLRLLEAVQNPDVRLEGEAAAAQTLLKVDDTARRSSLICEALKNARSAESRGSLLALLPGCGDAPALAALVTALTDSDPRVRDTGVRVLAEWPDMAAWDPLISLAQKPENEALRQAAFRGLVRLVSDENTQPDAKLVEKYRQLLTAARTDGDRKLVLGALAGVKHVDALQIATSLLATSAVRPEAELAVKKIAEGIKPTNAQAAEEALKQLQPK